MHGIRASLLAAVLAVGIFSVPTSSTAQTAMDVQHFQPQADRTGWFVTQSAQTLDLWQPAFGLWLNYGHNPFVRRYDGEIQDRIVGGLLTMDLQAAIGFGPVDVALDVPVHLAVAGEGMAAWGTEVGGAAMGDIRVIPKVRFIDPDKGGFGLGLALPVSFPTGNGDKFVGMRTASIAPTVLLTGHMGVFRVGGNLGYRIAGADDVANLTTGPAFLYRVAASVAPHDVIEIGAELYGDVGGSDPNNNPTEWLVGATVHPVPSLGISLGGGTALGSGVGSPDGRIVFGIGWSPAKPKDTDGDGINDLADDCVDVPEDPDDFEDRDGCPDPDNDNDNFLDHEDACPDEAEDLNGVDDADGCPDTDNDGDGVADVNDECPDTPEDEPDGWEDGNGCPDPDNDNDKFLDPDDACPDEAEVLNGVDDEDGCPDEAKVELDVERKEIYILEKVYFDLDRATIKRESHAILDDVADLLAKFDYVTRIEIQGHTDTRGEDDYNMELSQARADAVRKYLMDKGVAPQRLVAKGYGESQTIATGDTEEVHAQNRRVQFIVLEMSE